MKTNTNQDLKKISSAARKHKDNKMNGNEFKTMSPRLRCYIGVPYITRHMGVLGSF